MLHNYERESLQAAITSTSATLSRIISVEESFTYYNFTYRLQGDFKAITKWSRIAN